MGDPSSGRVMLWVTLLHGLESTCACDVKLEVRNGLKVGDFTDVRAPNEGCSRSIDRGVGIANPSASWRQSSAFML
ncbi:hypothetical protein SUGI_0510620 [Cryptomeria japonica]|nr:hypothetical protein SUGI_0510620 [Cryptomeria japonica]